MQTIWKGSISFGLVIIPVHLYSATEEHDVPLHQVHAEDGGRVRLKRYCELEDKPIPYAEVVKGYEAPDGRTITLSDQDLAGLPLPSTKVIDVVAFVDAAEIDPLMFSKAYYVGIVDKAAAKPYALLRDALTASGKIAVTKIALRSRESPAVLRVHDGALVLQTCIWPDEVRSAAGIAPEEGATVRPQELKMARSLMDSLSEGFDIGQLRDNYQQALRQVVEARLQGVELPREEEEAAPDHVIDLMEALRGSLRRAKGGEGEEAPARRRAPARKSAATTDKAAAASAKKSTSRRAPGSTTESAKKSTSTAKKTATAKRATATKSTATTKSTAARSTSSAKSAGAKSAGAKGGATAKSTTTAKKTAAGRKAS